MSNSTMTQSTKPSANKPARVTLPNGASCPLSKVETVAYADVKKKLLLKDANGEILIACRFDSDEEAEEEMLRINAMIEG